MVMAAPAPGTVVVVVLLAGAVLSVGVFVGVVLLVGVLVVVVVLVGVLVASHATSGNRCSHLPRRRSIRWQRPGFEVVALQWRAKRLQAR